MEKKLHWYDHLAVNGYVLGLSIGSGILSPLLTPYLVVLFMGQDYKNTYLATVRVVGLAVAMFIQPLAGMLSDRSTSRFGRRRPYIFVSAIMNVIFLAFIGLSPSFRDSGLDGFFKANLGITTAFAVLLFATILMQFSSNIGQGAVQGLLPDVVPPSQRGIASGVKSMLELLPSVLIFLFAVGKLVDHGQVWAVVIILMLGYLLTMIANLFIKETPLTVAPPNGGTFREAFWRILALTVIFVGISQASILLVRGAGNLLAGGHASLTTQIVVVGLAGLVAMTGSVLFGVYFGAWIGIGKDARSQTGFIWWVINRLLFLAAVGAVRDMAQYFLADVLHIPDAAHVTTLLLAVVAIFLIVSALGGGALADKVGHRRLVFYSGLVGAAGTVLLIFARNVPMVVVSGCIIGLAAGTFMATNWALGTRLVPPQDAGRYLGISNLAGAGAGIIGVGIGGPLADFFNHLQPGLGYLVLFGIFAALFFMSSLLMVKVPQAGAAD